MSKSKTKPPSSFPPGVHSLAGALLLLGAAGLAVFSQGVGPSWIGAASPRVLGRWLDLILLLILLNSALALQVGSPSSRSKVWFPLFWGGVVLLTFLEGSPVLGLGTAGLGLAAADWKGKNL